MSNTKLTFNFTGMLTASALCLVLSTQANAEQLQKLSKLDNSVYTNYSGIKPDRRNKKINLTAEDALLKAKQILSTAKKSSQYISAYRYLRYAAGKGHLEAMFQCAILILDNQYTPADDEQAIRYLEIASDKGHKQAEIALNYMRHAEFGFGC